MNWEDKIFDLIYEATNIRGLTRAYAFAKGGELGRPGKSMSGEGDEVVEPGTRGRVPFERSADERLKRIVRGRVTDTRARAKVIKRGRRTAQALSRLAGSKVKKATTARDKKERETLAKGELPTPRQSRRSSYDPLVGGEHLSDPMLPTSTGYGRRFSDTERTVSRISRLRRRGSIQRSTARKIAAIHARK